MSEPLPGAKSAGSMPLSVEQAALQVGLSASYLNKMRMTGEGPTFCKIGRRVVYRHDDLEQWIHARRFTSTSEVEAA